MGRQSAALQIEQGATAWPTTMGGTRRGTGTYTYGHGGVRTHTARALQETLAATVESYLSKQML